MAICRISLRFFSPPEKPSLTARCSNSSFMSDTLIDRLSQVPQLRIAARTSSFSFKGKAATVQEIGAALGVVALVEGSVQRQGDTLRITAELIRVADGTRLWSQAYDRKAKDLFAIQDEIASAVTTALVGKLLPKTKAALAKHGTDNLEAYQFYIQGHQAMNRVSMDAFKRAEKYLRASVGRDPNYVSAMLDLAQCWGWQYNLGAYGKDEFQRRAGPMPSAVINATLARRNNVAASRPCSGASAMPTAAAMSTLRPDSW